jgi:hypothetical protein
VQVYRDFDGTMSVQDTTDFVLSRLADPEWQNIERLWREGEIGSDERMRRQISHIRVTSEPIDDPLGCVSTPRGYYGHLNGNPCVAINSGVSTPNRFYIRLGFGSSYQTEHRYRTCIHWTKLPGLQDQLKQRQDESDVQVVRTCHAPGFMAIENREPEMRHADR